MENIRCEVGDRILNLNKILEVKVNNRVINLFTDKIVNVPSKNIENSDKFSNKEVI